mmetsp:Transcript_9531/g.58105  ORF Transcript_9531/g.58105 Transcript_9531/m.58105 type:complete len:90 (+) Transcript_9531:484-753(+)
MQGDGSFGGKLCVFSMCAGKASRHPIELLMDERVFELLKEISKRVWVGVYYRARKKNRSREGWSILWSQSKLTGLLNGCAGRTMNKRTT